MLSRQSNILCYIGALALLGAPVAHAAGGAPGRTDAPAHTWLVPAGPGARAYQTLPLASRRERDADTLAASLAIEVEKAVVAAHAPPLVRDTRLDRVSVDLARWAATRPLPPFEAVAFLQAYYGIVEQPGPNLILVRGSDEPGVLVELRSQLRSALVGQACRRWGVGLQRASRAVVVVLALQDQQLELAPVRRRLTRDERVRLRGRLLGPYRDPELLVTAPGGAVTRHNMSYQRGRFEGGLACDAGEGVYQVEIGATDRGGPAVLANFPVYCGVEPPVRLSVTQANDGVRQVAQKPAEAERELFSLINRARAAANLPPLILEPRLSQVARDHSREMARTGQVAHVSAHSGDALQRLKAGRVEPLPRRIAENVGQDYSAAQIHVGFMSSPGHRGNLTSPGMTHVGIGVAAGAGPDHPLYFTEVFAAWK